MRPRNSTLSYTVKIQGLNEQSVNEARCSFMQGVFPAEWPDAVHSSEKASARMHRST